MEAARVLDHLFSRFSLLGAVAAAFVAAAQPGCSSNGLSVGGGNVPASEETSQGALSSTMSFAIYAQNSARLGDMVEVHGGDVGVKQIATGPTLVSNFELVFSNEAKTDSDRTIYANRLELWNQTRVGPIQVNYSAEHSNVIRGSKTAFPSSMPSLPSLATVTPGTTPLNLVGTSTANPGRYGAVSVGNAAIWKLNPGVYHLASLHIENDARVEAQGPVQIRIAGRLDGLDRAWIVPATTAPTMVAGDLRIEVSGKNGAGGSLAEWPKSVQFGTDAHISGVVLVPNGTLQFAARAILTGAYMAKDISIDNQGKVYYQSGLGASGCLQDCNDGLPCTLDTCTNGTCTHSNAAAGASCSDGNGCNGAETCNGSGQCLPGTPPPPCQALDQCHLAGICDPTSGLCSNPVRADGDFCSTDNSDTMDGVCTMGKCERTEDCAPVAHVSAGGAHTCAIRRDGSLWCWGRNDRGQLGVGDLEERSDAVRAGSQLWNWTEVSAGAQHTCAIRRDSTLWCWGDNSSGQLGDGTTELRISPVQVNGSGWLTIRAGKRFTCGVTSAGAAYCWGDNSSGNLGNGSQDSSLVPIEVVGSNWVGVAVGYDHACGIQGDTTLWCWGANGSGQLGDGTSNAKLSPVQVSGTGWTSVTAGASEGDAFTCGNRLDGSLWCWGSNSNGQLGLGTLTSSTSPVRVGTRMWLPASTAGGRTSAVSFDATLWSWGKNDLGQLGDGTQTQRMSPVRVPGNTWVGVSVGESHSCGSRQDGSLWCWGDNASGAVKNGAEMVLAPSQVTGELCAPVPICGNGVDQEGWEECDDGNNQDGDRCSWDCKVEKCFDIVCEQPSNQCEESTCDPIDGECKVHPKQNGAACNDDNACTQTDTCQVGQCTGGNNKDCQASRCFEAGICIPESGECDGRPIDNVGCNINLRVDGIVKLDNGKYAAIFGYNSSASSAFGPTENIVYEGDVANTLNPVPAPPAFLAPGNHVGAFLPTFEPNHSITWRVDGQPVTASEASTLLPLKHIGNGTAVVVGGRKIWLTPNMNEYNQPPPEPTYGDDPQVGPNYKGSLSGSLTVSQAGAAVYTVPIAIPPGVAGMAPNLNLVYNSQGGSGIAGQGWELTGMSTIYRCPKTQIQDGFSKAVRMDATPVAMAEGDGVCLDGNRLFPRLIGGVPTFTFSTEMADFSSISYNLAADSFTVTTKSGEKRRYGSRADSRVKLSLEDDNGIVPNQKVAAVWSLDTVTDVWGNFYELHYNDDDPTTVQSKGLVLTRIDYTGHLSASGEIDFKPDNHITFKYRERSDPRNMRFRDSVLPRKMLLTEISSARGTYGLDYSGSSSPVFPPENKMDGDKVFAIAFAPPNDLNECLSRFTIWATPRSPDADKAANCIRPLKFSWETFDPENQGGWWQESQNYAIPADYQGIGTQFVDIDQDGLVDFIQANLSGSKNGAWKNTGTGWQRLDNWTLPTYASLAHGSGAVRDVMILDIDRDGLPDLVNVGRQGAGNDGIFVWLNGSRSSSEGQNIWRPQPSKSGGLSDSTVQIGPTGALQMGDIDADGYGELINVAAEMDGQTWTGKYRLIILKTDGKSWKVTDQKFILPNPINVRAMPLVVRDVDQDGYADLIPNDPIDPVDVWYNTGYRGIGDFGSYLRKGRYAGVEQKFLTGMGDLDGDGRRDSVFQVTTDPSDSQLVSPECEGAKVSLNSGVSMTELGVGGFVSALRTYGWAAEAENGSQTWSGWNQFKGPSERGRYLLADINGDGLSDVVLNHSWGGALLLNRNSTFEDIGGISGHPNWPEWTGICGHPSLGLGRTFLDPMPSSDQMNWAIPTAIPPTAIKARADSTQQQLDYFVDINGDGAVDRVQALMCDRDKYADCPGDFARKTYLNKYHRPFIKAFPNGLADDTTVAYSIITDKRDDAYDDLLARESKELYFASPIRVVRSVAQDSGVDTFGTTYYSYSSFRMSSEGRGPLGFKEIRITDPLGFETTTSYSQSYPLTGRPVHVTRRKGGAGSGLISESWTSYTSGVDRPIFVYANSVDETTYLFGPEDSEGRASVVESVNNKTDYTYDSLGNLENTTVTTTSSRGEKYERKITNSYSSEVLLEKERGKIKKVEVRTQKLAPIDLDGNRAITHTTTFEYGAAPALPLKKKKVEEGRGIPLELHTAYDYDEFGNLTGTTICAEDFQNCGKEPANPAFRRSLVSYKTAEYAPGPGGDFASLSYRDGLFPVKTTNAAGHVEYTAYDPVLGVVVQQTGPNGLHTRIFWDELGWKNAEIVRFNRQDLSQGLTTSYERKFVLADESREPAHARIVTITTPPEWKKATWTYIDGLGRTVGTLARSFGTDFTETRTEYNHFGQVARTAKPFQSGASASWSTPHYDFLGRIDGTTEELGIIGIPGSGEVAKPVTKVTKIEFQGSTVTTSEEVRGEKHKRTESKNVLGKVALVTDDKGNTQSFGYDAEGNLTGTWLNGATKPQTTIGYDDLGRKKWQYDQDMGFWIYDHNGFGELVSQTDTKLKKTRMSYDSLGRMISRTLDADTSKAKKSTWIYDIAEGAGIGKLAAVVGPPDADLKSPCSAPSRLIAGVENSGNRPIRWLSYTGYGETAETNDCIDGETFTSGFEYDHYGRQSVVRYPHVGGTRFAAKYNYTDAGFLYYVSNPDDDAVYWQAEKYNALGQVTTEQTRNGVLTVSMRNPTTGWLQSSLVRSRAQNDKLIEGATYGYDEAGNLLMRTRSQPEEMADTSETFGYDSLDRLTSSVVKTKNYNGSEAYTYDSLGNFLTKGGKTYSYSGCGDRPHAVCSVDGGEPFVYDSNGSLTSGGGRKVTYTAENKVKRIRRATGDDGGEDVVDFVYGADGQRVVQSVGSISNGADEKTESARTVYVGLGGTGRGLYERTTRKTPERTQVEHVHFIYAGGTHGGNAFALFIKTEANASGEQPQTPTETTAYSYYHFDHLGSVTAISDELGRVKGLAQNGANSTALGYDPWGKRRNADGTPAETNSLPLHAGHREFTGHETIPSVGLVNMNGRVYDPDLGRFLSGDPNIQLVADLQSYNRYSYALNNPLRYTDPTGYFLDFLSSGSFWKEVGLIALGVAACTNTFTCTMYTTVSLMYLNATAIKNGAHWDQVLMMDLFAVGASMYGSAFSSSMTAALKPETGVFLSSFVGRMMGSVASAGFMVAATGNEAGFGKNMLIGLASAAGGAALDAAFEKPNPVSQAQKRGDRDRPADINRMSREGLSRSSRGALSEKSDAVGLFNPSGGKDAEVVFWEPVGYGESAFGHVSVRIGEESYSFGPGGMDVQDWPDYLQRQDFRNGHGIVLRLDQDQVAALEMILVDYQRDVGRYNVLWNNCGDPVQNFFQTNLKVDMGVMVLPSQLESAILQTQYAGARTYYKGAKAGAN